MKIVNIDDNIQIKRTHIHSNAAWRRRIWSATKLIIGLGLLGFVASQTSLADLRRAWLQMQFGWLLPSWIGYFLVLSVMAARSWELINRQAPLRAVMILTAIQTLIGNMLANSAGAVSFVTMLRVRHRIPLSQGILSVVVSKLADLLLLLIVLTCGSALVWPRIAALHSLVLALLALIAVGIAGGFGIVVFRRPLVRIVDRLALRFPLLQSGRGASLTRLLSQLADDHGDASRQAQQIALYSVLNTGLGLLFGYFNFQLLGLPLEPAILVFFTALTQLIAWVPISVFGGLGVFEVSSILILSLFGYTNAQLVPVFISSRIYFYALNLSLLPILLLDKSSNSR